MRRRAQSRWRVHRETIAEALAHFCQRAHDPPLMVARPRGRWGCWSGREEVLVMRHPSKPLLDKAIAYRAGAIGLGLLPLAMAFAAVLIP